MSTEEFLFLLLQMLKVDVQNKVFLNNSNGLVVLGKKEIKLYIQK